LLNIVLDHEFMLDEAMLKALKIPEVLKLIHDRGTMDFEEWNILTKIVAFNNWILAKPKVLLRAILIFRRLPCDNVLEELKGLPADHIVFAKPEVLLIAIFKIRKIPDPNSAVFKKLVERDNNDLIFQMPEILLRAILIMEKMPGDSILKELKDLPADHIVFKKPVNLLIAILEKGKIPNETVLQRLKGVMDDDLFRRLEILRVLLWMDKFPNKIVLLRVVILSVEHKIFSKPLVVVEMILERDTMPAGSVLNGLGELPEAHQIFQNKAALRKVMDEETMPDEEELQELIRSTQQTDTTEIALS